MVNTAHISDLWEFPGPKSLSNFILFGQVLQVPKRKYLTICRVKDKSVWVTSEHKLNTQTQVPKKSL
jgi:hypothetical protein